jgi:hypothetical protein
MISSSVANLLSLLRHPPLLFATPHSIPSQMSPLTVLHMFLCSLIPALHSMCPSIRSCIFQPPFSSPHSSPHPSLSDITLLLLLLLLLDEDQSTGRGVEKGLLDLLRSVVQSNSETVQGTHALMLSVLQSTGHAKRGGAGV